MCGKTPTSQYKSHSGALSIPSTLKKPSLPCNQGYEVAKCGKQWLHFHVSHSWVEMSTWMRQGSPCLSVPFSSFSPLRVAFSCMSTHLANAEPLSQEHLRLILWACAHGAFVSPSTHKFLCSLFKDFLFNKYYLFFHDKCISQGIIPSSWTLLCWHMHLLWKAHHAFIPSKAH